MASSDSVSPIHATVPPNLLVRRGIWILAGTTGLLILLGFSLGLVALVSSDGAMNPFTHLLWLPLSTTIYGLTGLLIARRYPGNAVGWLLLVVGMCSAVTLVSAAYAEFARYVPSPTLPLLIWLDRWTWVIPSIVPLTLVLLYFPDGRLPSPRWRWLVWCAGVGIASVMIYTAFYPAPQPEYGLPQPNPYGTAGSEALLDGLIPVAGLLLGVGVVGAFVSVIVRYRRSRGMQRIQLKWLLYAAMLVLVMFLMLTILWVLIPENPLLVELGIMVNSGGVTLIIMAIGFAILRHNLWDVDTLINRTLVYSLLTLIVTGMYILIVSFLSVLFAGDNLLLSLVATGVVAVSFQPLRESLQTQVNRLLFGLRDEPYDVLQRLSSRLEPVVAMQDVLPVIAVTIAESLRLPYVAVMLRGDGTERLVAAHPADKTPPANVERLPLIYQTEMIGYLVLTQRSQDEAFTATEYDLLETIARQVAVAAYNVRLTEDLQHSRQAIVTAREEERRRLRRDLHDGLGPVLAAMSFRLDAAYNFVAQDPDQALQLIADLKTQVQSVLSEIRRIAYNLRPPALDELGLLDALRQHIDSAQESEGMSYVLDFPTKLPFLSAAVEVAVYRIVMEAVTNVQRHANAANCIVRIHPDEPWICIDITDDGCGIIAGQAAGVGLNAMRERADELGGQFTIESAIEGGGTRIRAQLPFEQKGKT